MLDSVTSQVFVVGHDVHGMIDLIDLKPFANPDKLLFLSFLLIDIESKLNLPERTVRSLMVALIPDDSAASGKIEQH